MSLMKIKKLVVTFAVWVAAGTICLAANPMMGTWKFNDAKSKIKSGTRHNTMVVYTKAGMGKMKCTVDGMDAKGKPAHNEWTGKFDGKDYPVTGDPTSDTRSYTKVDDRTYDIALKKGGKATGTVRIAVSADGKTRTVTINSATPRGKKFTNTEVYDKQ